MLPKKLFETLFITTFIIHFILLCITPIIQSIIIANIMSGFGFLLMLETIYMIIVILIYNPKLERYDEDEL